MPHQVIMPRLSQEMEEGVVVQWLKKAGEAVAQGDTLFVVETDKANMDVAAQDSGVLQEILVPAGGTAAVGTVIAFIAEPGEERVQAPGATPAQASGKSDRSAESAGPMLPTAPTPEKSGFAVGDRRPASPAARRVARDLGVDVGQVKGTGSDGRVTEADVRTYAAVPNAPSGESPENVDVLPMTPIRRRIAERLAASRQIAADVTTVTDVDMTAVAATRQGSGASYTAYLVWAAARSLREYPILNSSLLGDKILLRRDIHLGVAVSIDQALVVPVIRFADLKSIQEISSEIDDLAARAREGSLTPAELSGSTFTITNSGSFGSLFFTPIINQPEAAILGMGKIADAAVVRDGQIVVRRMMYLCLSYDHRIVDGAPAGAFLQEVKRRLEQPD